MGKGEVSVPSPKGLILFFKEKYQEISRAIELCVYVRFMFKE